MKHFDVKTTPIEELFPDPDENRYKREGIQRMCNLVRTALCDEHIHHIQFNCQDKKVLLDAQKHPEQYKHLVVRVAGYSALFTTLSKSLQDDIIRRTEQGF